MMLQRLGHPAARAAQAANSTPQNGSTINSRPQNTINSRPRNSINSRPRNSINSRPLFVVASSRRVAPADERQHQLQQQQQQRLDAAAAAASRRRASVKLPQLLTTHISAATSLSQLHDVVASYGNRLNHFHVAKLLSRASQLASDCSSAPAAAASTDPSQQQQQQQPAQQQQESDQQLQHLQLLHARLSEMMAQRARHATPETLVAAVAAMGRLRALLYGSSSTPPPAAGSQQQQQWQQHLQLLAGRAVELRAAFSVSQLSALLWGFGKAGLAPSRSCLNALLEAAMQAYHLAYQQQEQQQQAQKLDSSASGASSQQPLLPRPARPQQQQQQQQHKSGTWQQRKRRQSRPHQHSLATDLALVVYATAAMSQEPQQQWLQQWQSAVLQQLPAANPQDLSMMLWGLAVLRQNPGGQLWLDRVLLAFADKLEGAGSQALANSIWAVQCLTQQQQQQQQQQGQPPSPAKQGPVLPAAWRTAFLQALFTEPSLASTPQALSCCLASLARLQIIPDPSKLRGLLDASLDSLPQCTPRQLTDLLWACASFNLQPSPHWLKAFLTTAARAADVGRFSVQQLGTLVWSLAVVKPPAAALLMSQQLQVQVLLQAVATAQQGQGLRLIGPAGRSSLAWALASLGVSPDRSWLGQFLAAAFAEGLASDQVRCASLLFCIASLDFEFLVEWLGDFLEGKYGDGHASGGSELDLSLRKYAALVGVLEKLADMDSRQLRAAWLDQTLTPEWSGGEDALGGPLGSAMPLSPALLTWVDSLAVSDQQTSAAAAAVGAAVPESS